MKIAYPVHPDDVEEDQITGKGNRVDSEDGPDSTLFFDGGGGGGDDDGCDHGDHSEGSDADSPDTDAG